MTQPLTADERATIKAAAFGAVILVSNTDPGLRAMLKETFAAAGEFAAPTGLVHEVLTARELPQLPTELADIEQVVLPNLRRSMEILRAKAPQEAEGFRTVVLTAVERAAQAAQGISPNEAEMVAKVRQALGAAG